MAYYAPGTSPTGQQRPPGAAPSLYQRPGFQKGDAYQPGDQQVSNPSAPRVNPDTRIGIQKDTHGQLANGEYTINQGFDVGPNGMPVYDPYNKKVGPGLQYMNNAQFAGAAMQPVMGGIQSAVMQGLAQAQKPRSVPGMQYAGNEAGARQMQMGAAQALRTAGSGAAAQQAMLPGQLKADARPGLNVQNAALAGAGAVGMPEAAMQGSLNSMLMQGAAGQGPTAAQALFQQNLDRNIAAQRSMSVGARGQSAAAAARQGTQAGVQAGLQAGAQSAQLRAQEQQAAQSLASQQLGLSRGQDLSTLQLQGALGSQAQQDAVMRAQAAAGMLGQQRGQDIEQAGMYAGQMNQMRGQDQGVMMGAGDLGLRGRALDDAQRQQQVSQALGFGQLALGVNQADISGRLGSASMVNEYLLGRRGTDLQKRGLDQAETGMYLDFASDLTNAGAGMAAGGL